MGKYATGISSFLLTAANRDAMQISPSNGRRYPEKTIRPRNETSPFGISFELVVNLIELNRKSPQIGQIYLTALVTSI